MIRTTLVSNFGKASQVERDQDAQRDDKRRRCVRATRGLPPDERERDDVDDERRGIQPKRVEWTVTT